MHGEADIEVLVTAKHMVLFRFRPEADPTTRQAVLDRLAELPSHYPAMDRFGLGENVSERDDSFSHAMTMEFATLDALRAYLNSDRHEALVRDWFAPAVAARVIVSYVSA